MKSKIYKYAIIAVFVFASLNLNAQNSALSLHMWGNDNFQGDIIMKTLKVPHKTLNTYYCALMWNVGGEGAGYCGIQNHTSGNNFIFSIWDPISSTEAIKAAFTGTGTQIANFGGEGTGLQSMNYTLGWTEGHEYTMVARRWPVEDHTYFGYWVYDLSSENWTHLVTMDYPVANVLFDGSTGSFIEDWSNTGANLRKVYQKNGYKRKTDGTWVPFDEINFEVNTSDAVEGGRCYNYRNNFDAGTEDEYYYMISGGTAYPTFNGTSSTFKQDMSAEPNYAKIDFYLTELNENTISWTIPNSSLPQFRVQISIGNQTIVDTIDSEINSYPISASAGSNVRIQIEDILGNTVTNKYQVGAGGLAPKTPTNLVVTNSGSSSFSISWDKNENETLYRIQLQEKTIWKTVDSTSDNFYSFSNLNAATRYRTRVRAENNYGISSYSDFVLAITPGTSDVSKEESVPQKYELRNAYPNPFNPSTTINYSIPIPGRVKISVYNSIGRLVDTLIDSEVPAGDHTVNWNASNCASGVYYYRMSVSSYSSTNKFVLLK